MRGRYERERRERDREKERERERRVKYFLLVEFYIEW